MASSGPLWELQNNNLFRQPGSMLNIGAAVVVVSEQEAVFPIKSETSCWKAARLGVKSVAEAKQWRTSHLVGEA